MQQGNRKERFWAIGIWSFSIVLITAIGLLFFAVEPQDFGTGPILNRLPLFHACINAATALLLIFSLWAIKLGKVALHQRFNILALTFSALFLCSYVVYHSQAESTSYGGDGWLKYLYYFVLLSHILLSIAVVPLVLFTLRRAVRKDFERHKKLARITWPIWFYVALTGVLVYVMISPYYG